MYEVFLERAAERALKRLSRRDFTRIITAIKELAANPRPSGCRKLSGGDWDWRLRIGDYRVLYEVDDEARAVRVLLVRHRREAYR